MAELREFGLPRGNFDQGAARACNGASEHFYKHPWCSQSNASVILFFPSLIRNLFENHGVADCDDFMHLAPMQALAMRCQFPFFGGFPAARLLIILAGLPAQSHLAPFL